MPVAARDMITKMPIHRVAHLPAHSLLIISPSPMPQMRAITTPLFLILLIVTLFYRIFLPIACKTKKSITMRTVKHFSFKHKRLLCNSQNFDIITIYLFMTIGTFWHRNRNQESLLNLY